MDAYEKLGKLISEKLDSSENETAAETVKTTETIEQKENQPKTFGDVNTASFLFNEKKDKIKTGEIVHNYILDTPVKLAEKE